MDEKQSLNQCEAMDTKRKGGGLTVTKIRQYPIVPFVLIILAGALMTLTASFVKWAKKEVDIYFIIMIRFCAFFLVSMIIIVAQNSSLFPDDKLILLSIRGICGTVASFAMLYGFANLPLGDCAIILAIQPVFATLIARIYLKERCGLFELIIISLSLVGIVIVIQPPFLFGSSYVVEKHDKTYYIAATVTLIGVLFGSMASVTTRKLKTVNLFVITAWAGMIGLIPAILIHFFLGKWENPSLETLVIVITAGVGNLVSVLLLAFSYKMLEAGTVSLMAKSSQIIMFFAAGAIFFGTEPNALNLVGSGIVVVCMIVSGARKMIEKRAPHSQFTRSICCFTEPKGKVDEI